jgi:hypothetical protein
MAKTVSTGSYPCQGDSGQLQFEPCLSNFDHNYLIKQPDQPGETAFVSMAIAAALSRITGSLRTNNEKSIIIEELKTAVR